MVCLTKGFNPASYDLFQGWAVGLKEYVVNEVVKRKGLQGDEGHHWVGERQPPC